MVTRDGHRRKKNRLTAVFGSPARSLQILGFQNTKPVDTLHLFWCILGHLHLHKNEPAAFNSVNMNMDARKLGKQSKENTRYAIESTQGENRGKIEQSPVVSNALEASIPAKHKPVKPVFRFRE